MKTKRIISYLSICFTVFLGFYYLSSYVFATSSNLDDLNENESGYYSNYISLPIYQPIWERSPEGFTEESLKRFKEENPAIGISTLRESIDESTIVNFKGYIGPYYLTKNFSDSVKVLEDTINIRSNDGLWSAMGLIRNETFNIVDSIYVKALLKDAEGNVIEETETKVNVNHVRSGEPAPFTINSNASLDKVSHVEWYVKEQDSSLGEYSRDFVIYNHYEIAYGVTNINGKERIDDPSSYLIQTGVENLGDDTNSASITIAWLDEDGKVYWMESTELDVNYHGVKKGSRAHFKEIIVRNPEIAPMLDQLYYMMWVVGE